MKYDKQKAFPYPILSDTKDYSDDYEYGGFQADIALTSDKSGERVVLTVDFALTEEAILSCIEQGTANYGVHVLCTKTNYRRLLRSSDNVLEHSFEPLELYGDVDFMPCVVCTEPIPEYQSSDFHEELRGQKFDMPMGAVLAIAEFETYHINPKLRSLSSIFELIADKYNKKGNFAYSIETDAIVIKIPEAQYARFDAMRSSSDTQLYAMMSVYYPVLVEVLRIMATDGEAHDSKQWYNAIQTRLQHLKITLNEKNDEKIYEYAQELMEYPLTQLPEGE